MSWGLLLAYVRVSLLVLSIPTCVCLQQEGGSTWCTWAYVQKEQGPLVSPSVVNDIIAHIYMAQGLRQAQQPKALKRERHQSIGSSLSTTSSSQLLWDTWIHGPWSYVFSFRTGMKTETADRRTKIHIISFPTNFHGHSEGKCSCNYGINSSGKVLGELLELSFVIPFFITLTCIIHRFI